MSTAPTIGDARYLRLVQEGATDEQLASARVSMLHALQYATEIAAKVFGGDRLAYEAFLDEIDHGAANELRLMFMTLLRIMRWHFGAADLAILFALLALGVVAGAVALIKERS